MAFEGYLSLGGTEIGNVNRFGAYVRNLGIMDFRMNCNCPDLDEILDDEPYVNPTSDNAPWYDVNNPISAQFAGVWIQTVTGIDNSPISRTYTDLIGAGAITGAPYDQKREIHVTAWLAGASEQGLSYGLAWLGSALRGSGDCSFCEGDEMCILDACPEGFDTPDSAWTEHNKTLFDVTLSSGPTVLEKKGFQHTCNGTKPLLAKVEFVLTSVNPWIFSTPVDVATGLAFTDDPTAGCDIEWIPVSSGLCPVIDPCAQVSCGAGCGALTPVVNEPVSTTGCACTERISSASLVASAPSDILPNWLDAVPIITITTGSAEMRRVTVRFYHNPLDRPCEDLNVCNACSEINVTYLPADATAVIDGRMRHTTVTCAAGTESYDHVTFGGPNGAPADWPALSCGSGLCVEVLVDADHYAADARVSIALASRQDLA